MVRKRTLITFLLAAATVGKVGAKEIAVGYIITKEHDTIPGTFDIPVVFSSKEPNYRKLQEKVVFSDNPANRQDIFPGSVYAIMFRHNDVEITMISAQIGTKESGEQYKKQYAFVLLERDGTLRLLRLYLDHLDIFQHYETLYLQKNEGPLFTPEKVSFKQDLMTYLADCPALFPRIKEESDKVDDIDIILEQLASEYNEACGNKRKQVNSKK